MGILKRSLPPKPDRATVSIIAQGNRFSGDLNVAGKLHIDGSFEGHLHSEDALSVGRHGEVRGQIRARQIWVSGLIEGEVVSDELHIEPGGTVSGRICCAKLSVHEKGTFVGYRTLPDTPMAALNLVDAMPASGRKAISDESDLIGNLPNRITLSPKG